MKIEFQLNNKNEIIEVDPSRRLLDILRDDFGLKSVKEGCGEGECGACIILLDGKAVNSCLISAGMINGKSILTLEEFNKTDEYKLIEESFLEAGSVQCGFCTSGMVMSTAGLLNVNKNPNETEIKEALSGNLCRCTGYQMIVEGVKLAVEKMEKEIPLAKSQSRKEEDNYSLGNNAHQIAKSQKIVSKKGEFANTIDEALEILDNEEVTIISGGTDLMVKNAGSSGVKPKFNKQLLFIGNLDQLKKIQLIDEKIHIGSAVTLNELLMNENIPEVFKELISEMASFPTRNLATIGGNIINASPAGDTLPFLYAADAELVLKSKQNERTITIDKFIYGPGKTIIDSNEILYKIIIPAKSYDINYYKKAGSRKGMSLSKASFIGMVDFENDKVSDVRIAFGAVASTVVRSRDLEKKMIGKTKREIDSVYFEVVKKYNKLIKPIDDSRSSKSYRKDVCIRILKEFFGKIIKSK
ncbi:MAG: FAD binding domain-containing protein [Candidatus Marinimicrobia bacterium]|nr:FAD binding domain-containing protein [Candidatus Neomarinimicrobiota bacterium]